MAEMREVRSSNVRAVGWDEDTGELLVEFRNGSLYSYPSAGESAYQDLLSDP